MGLHRSIPRQTCDRRKDVWKVIFFQPSSPTQKKCIFLKEMKILDFTFLLFVLTNKNLCLKQCVVFYFQRFLDRRTILVSILTFRNWPHRCGFKVSTESLLQFSTRDGSTIFPLALTAQQYCREIKGNIHPIISLIGLKRSVIIFQLKCFKKSRIFCYRLLRYQVILKQMLKKWWPTNISFLQNLKISLTPKMRIHVEAGTSHASRVQAKLVRIFFKPAE